MKPTLDVLEQRVSAAMQEVAGQEGCAAIVRLATDPAFGDYQVNGVMPLAKKLKTDARKLAEQVVARLDVNDICEQPEVAGPGFINLRLRADFVGARLLEVSKDKTGLGVDKAETPRTVVVDFSSPNVAKQMHVGHLRSTIIGDCICRLLEFLGHKVIRQNHIGDWGTQFGMLIEYLERHAGGRLTDPAGQLGPISDQEALYRAAKAEFDSDPEFAERARKHVVNLHKHDPYTCGILNYIIAESRRHYCSIYNRLGVNLTEKDERGESYYSRFLPGIVAELREKGIAVDSDGAICVFPPGFQNKQGQPLPFIVQKSDGAYLYATTDLAALRYRVDELKADEIVYVTDSRQKLHFEMLFAVARMAGWASEAVSLTHVMFGSVLGEDGRPLKTREGQNVKLEDLLDEAVERARAVVEQKNPDLPADKKEQIARAVGIGAVKYADYSNNRTSDYVFSFEKMLAMDGNTAPYMQYAYARIRSIERKAQTKDVDIETELANVRELDLSEPAELDLAKHLIRYGQAVEAAAADYRPNYLTAYLYELAQKFSVFYTNCPVLAAKPAKRPTRLMLSDLTARTIRHGLSRLLGIEVVDQM